MRRLAASALVALVASFGVDVAVAYCINPVNASELRQLRYKGKGYDLPLAAGRWTSAGPVSEIVRILLEEKIKVRVQKKTFPSSTTLLKEVVGCTDSHGHAWNSTTDFEKSECLSVDLMQDPPVNAWAATEVWMTTEENLRLSIMAGSSDSMGYNSFPGMYTQSRVINKADREGVMLKWWEAYRRGSNSAKFFSTVAELDAQIRGLVPKFLASKLCPDGRQCGAGTLRPLCHSGLSPDYVSSMEVHDLSCDNGWWYSPACANATETCVPVVLSEFNWNMIHWCKVFRTLNLPFAVTWLGWFGAQEAVRQLEHSGFLFYWWEPDTAYLTLQPAPPEQVLFDDRDLQISQIQETALVTWSGLRHIDPDIFGFFRLVSLSNADLKELMLHKAAGMGDTEIACNWLQETANVKKWDAWLPIAHNQTVIIASAGVSFLTLFIALAVSVAGTALLLVAFYIGRRRHIARRDSPACPATPTGAWVLKWAGAHQQSRLMGQSSAKASKGGSWIVNATPFQVKLKIEIEGQAFMGITDWSRSRHQECLGHALDAWSFCASSLGEIGSSSLVLQVAGSLSSGSGDDDWRSLGSIATIHVEGGDWTQRPTDRDCQATTTPWQFCDPTVRKPLPDNVHSQPMGQLKLAKGPNHTLLILWSPPHIFRGVPILEFEQFLSKVIDHPRMWENCREVDVDGSTRLVSKAPRSLRRNMYDARDNIIGPEAAVVDASYAEIHTKHGPANLFVSHVWAESAHNTREAIRKLSDWIHCQTRARTSMQMDEESGNAGLRVWFCTICNNQSRVMEELGQDVLTSPFAQVLRSPFCHQVALVSPFRALNRKWCNYEFCLSRHEQKVVMMLTSEGVVQAGHVAPKTLNELAKRVMAFNCKDATCSSREDEVFIDAAVKQMGGYQRLDATLKDVFRQAIFDAHRCLNQALAIVEAVEQNGDMSDLSTASSAPDLDLEVGLEVTAGSTRSPDSLVAADVRLVEPKLADVRVARHLL